MKLTSRNGDPYEPGGRRGSVCWLIAALLIGLLCLMVSAGCRSSADSFRDPTFNPPPPASPSAAGRPSWIYATNELHEGDVVGITFQYSTNFNALQKIALDGMLNLDMVGPVKAAGKTVTDLQRDLTKVYQPLAKDDVITVKLISSGAIVYVSGLVLRPGAVELDRPLTVVEAIMAAGGFDNARAKLSGVTVLRIEGGRQQTFHINVKRVLEGGEKTPFYLKPFDIVYVPTKVFNY